MAVTAAMVKELRERTGAGMMECKKALVETGGDMDGAIEFLRKSGLAQADKKASRVAAEGKIALAVSDDAREAVHPRSSAHAGDGHEPHRRSCDRRAEPAHGADRGLGAK